MKDFSGLSIYETLERAALSYPERTAYDFLGYKRTYAEFKNDIDICAANLIQMGIGKGHVLSLFLPNIPLALVLFYAISKIGAISNFIHPKMPILQIGAILKLMNPSHIWIPGFMHKTITKTIEILPDAQIHLVHMHDYMTFLPRVFTLIKNLPSYIYNVTSTSKYYKNAKIPLTSKVHINTDETAVILLTGGTDGNPKGVCLSAKAINSAAASTAAIKTETDTQDIMLAILPVFHGYGLVNCIHTAFAEAAKVILLPYYNERMFKKAIIKKKPGYMLGIPRLYSKLADIFENENQDLSFFKGLYCGGSKLSQKVLDKVNTVLKSNGSPVEVREGYGLTECVGACLLMPEGKFKPQSIGIPYPGVTVAIVEPGTDTFLSTGSTGEIVIASKMIMNGYFGEVTCNIFTIDDVRWIRTGDLGSIDADGYVYFIDRIKRMIKISGYEVFPAKIENLINEINGVSNCCIVESEKNGLSELKAYIVVVSGKSVIQKLILEKLNEKLPGWSIPGEFVFVDSIPETLMKKNSYRKLS